MKNYNEKRAIVSLRLGLKKEIQEEAKRLDLTMGSLIQMIWLGHKEKTPMDVAEQESNKLRDTSLSDSKILAIFDKYKVSYNNTPQTLRI